MNLVGENVLKRVAKISTEAGTFGTGFFIERRGKTYLITALHVVKDVPRVTIRGYNFSQQTDVKLLPGIAAHADVAVLELPPGPPLAAPDVRFSAAELFVSQEVFFVGFPYGLGSTASDGGQIPFIKKGMLSAVDLKGVYYLDGINNPGFSGGPVCTGGGEKDQIVGIVSGYRVDWQKVYAGPANQEIDARVAVNTGIIVTYKIDHALTALPAL